MAIPLDASQFPIKAVTVFNSQKAEVIRTFVVNLAHGHNELVITALPSCIATESARIASPADAVLFDVVCSVEDTQDGQPSAESSALRTLKRHHAVLEGEKALKNRQMDIMEQYGRTLNAEHNTTSSVEAFLEFLDARGSSTVKAVAEIDAQIAEVNREIELESHKLHKKRQRSDARGRVSAVIMARRAGSVEITLTYMVSNATWSPSYDLHATTEEGEPSGIVSLHYRASIQQNTGEDWLNTAVSVSTATAGLLATIPTLRTMRISPGLSPLLSSGARSGPRASGKGPTTSFIIKNKGHNRTASIKSIPLSPSNMELTVDGAESWTSTTAEEQSITNMEQHSASDDKGSWTETKAIVVEGAVSSSFRIEGSCTIPSEATPHKATIAVLTFNAQIIHVAVPRSAPSAYLQCEVKNTSEYRLLEGPVTVFLDNSPVSKASIVDVSPYEVFKCTLGPDPRLRIKCSRLPRTVKSSGATFLAQSTVVTYKVYTSVYNAHGFHVRGLHVLDTAPDASRTSENESGPAIKVVIKHPEGLGDAAPEKLIHVASPSRFSSVRVRWGRDWGHKEGRYEWIVDIGPGEEVKLEAEYEIRAPADYVWHLSEDYFR